MARLDVQLGAAHIDQGAAFDARISLDPEGVPVASLRLRLLLPAEAFDGGSLSFTPDTYETTGPETLAGVLEVAVETPAPIAAPAEILVVSGTVTGLRGRRYEVRVRAVEAHDADGIPLALDPASAELLVSPGALAAIPDELPGAEVGVPYHGLLEAQGGEPPYVWTADGGTLPGGLSLGAGGVVAGTPTIAGAFQFTAAVSDAAGADDEASFAVTVLPQRPRIATSSLPNAASGVPYSVPLQLTGGAGGHVWEAAGLPPGLHVQGSRIAGTPSADRSTCGVYAVTLGVEDNAGRTDTRALEIVVLPTAAFTVPVVEPGALAVGRNLYVTTFDTDIGIGSFVPEIDESTRTILEGVLDDLMTDIAGLILGPDGVDLPPSEPPERPGVVDPVPGEPEPHPPSGGPREWEERRQLLGALLQEYKQVDEALTDTVSVDATVRVWIDGTLVKSHEPELWRKGGRWMQSWRTTAARRALRETRHWKAVNRSFGKGKARREALREARSHFRARLAEARARPRLGRTSAADGPRPLYFGGRGGGTTPGGIDIDPQAWLKDALDGLAEWMRHWLDDVFPPAVVSGGELELTPGPHRIRIAAEPLVLRLQSDPVDAAAAAGAQVVVNVRIAPRNTEGWPRLEHGLTWTSGPARGEVDETFDADLGGSALDIACAAGGEVMILAATGDPESPYSPPQAFDCSLGVVPTKLAAGRQDDIGRSALVAVANGQVRVALNAGVGGFRCSALARPDDAPVVGDVAFAAPAPDGWARIALLKPQAVEVWRGLGELLETQAGPAAVTTSPVRSLVANDRCTSLAYVQDPAGEDKLALAFFTAGTVELRRLEAGGSLGAAARLAGFDTIDPHRQVISIEPASVLPGRSFLLLGLRQGELLVPVEQVAGAPVASAPLPLRLVQVAPGPGDGGGAVVILGTDRLAAWAWWPGGEAAPQLLPLEPPGVRAVAGAESVVALSSSSEVRILVRD